MAFWVASIFRRKTRREDQRDLSSNGDTHTKGMQYSENLPLQESILTTVLQYSTQQIHLVHETPALYERIVKPYIDSFPASRTKWYSSSSHTLVIRPEKSLYMS